MSPRVLQVSAPRLRAGIIGAGLMGRWHGEAIRRQGGRVTAIMDKDPAAAAALARLHSGAVAITNLDDLPAATRLDVLHICTPTPSHPRLAARAMEMGLHVLVEKPLAATAAETRDLLAQAAAQERLLCPVHQFLFQDGVIRARRHLARLMPIRHLELSIFSAGGSHLPAAHADSVLAEILPHPLSLLQEFLAKDVDQVAWSVQRPAHGELIVTACVAGTAVRIHLSLNARPTECALRLRGDGGSLDADLFHGYSCARHAGVSRAHKVMGPFATAAGGFAAASLNLIRRTVKWEPAYPGLRPLIGAFYAAVAGAGPSPLSASHILAVAAARDAISREGNMAAGKT